MYYQNVAGIPRACRCSLIRLVRSSVEFWPQAFTILSKGSPSPFSYWLLVGCDVGLGACFSALSCIISSGSFASVGEGMGLATCEAILFSSPTVSAESLLLMRTGRAIA